MSQQLVDVAQSCGGSGQPLASAFVVPHPTRPNEDAYCICPLWLSGLGLVSFFGVYDGHSGSDVSRFLATSLHHYVEACGMISTDTASALCRAFQTAEAALEEATLNCPEAGSTATVALLSATNVIVANCGDSRALLCRGGHVMALTEDHRPARPDERERVLGSGGQILWNEGERVMGILATTRAFGDRDLKQFGVTAEPEVTIISRTSDDELLILATDGVFNVLTNEEVADIARRVLRRAMERGAPRAAAIRMAASAIGRFSRDRNSKDDITVVLVDLQPPGGPCPIASPQAAAAAELMRSKAAAATFATAAAPSHHNHRHMLLQPPSPSPHQQQQHGGSQQQHQKQCEFAAQKPTFCSATAAATTATAAAPVQLLPGLQSPWDGSTLAQYCRHSQRQQLQGALPSATTLQNVAFALDAAAATATATSLHIQSHPQSPTSAQQQQDLTSGPSSASQTAVAHPPAAAVQGNPSAQGLACGQQVHNTGAGGAPTPTPGPQACAG